MKEDNNENNSPHHIIKLKLRGRFILLNSEQLSSISGLKGGTQFVMDDKQTYESSYPLGYYNTEIEKCKLTQVHRSHWINLNKFHEYDHLNEKLIMNNGERIPLGESFKAEFIKWMNALS